MSLALAPTVVGRVSPQEAPMSGASWALLRTLPTPFLVPEYARELVLQRSLPECVAVLPDVDTLRRVQNVQHDVRYNFMSQCIDLRHVRPVRWIGFDVVGRSRIIKSRMMPSEERVDERELL